MAKLLQAFDATKVDPTQGAGSLPIGRHPVIIVESEVEGTKGGQSGMLVLTLKIIDGPQTGTTGPYRLNLYNQNPQAAQIAERQLSAVCHAIGVFNVLETEAMHNKPFMVDVGFQKGHEPNSGPDAKGYTEVKKVFDINGVEPGKKGQTQGGQGQQQNNGGNSNGQFDKQMEQDQRRHENGEMNKGGNGGNWGNQSNNNGGNQTGNNSGNWGNNGGQQTQQNQGGNGGNWGGNNSGNTGGQTQGNGGNGWGNNGGNNNANQGGNGGGSWQQNTNGVQGGGNSNGGWGQRN